MPIDICGSIIIASTIRNSLAHTQLFCHLWGCGTSLAIPAARRGTFYLELIGEPEVQRIRWWKEGRGLEEDAPVEIVEAPSRSLVEEAGHAW
jgi:hypothetical protein